MRARGFTLVEVLVALVIVAAGAAAVLSSLNTAAMSTIYLRDKTFAGWIAGNRIAETRLQTTRPQNGTTEGEVEYAGQRWQWRQQITDAQVPGLRRIDVSVRPVVPGAPAASAPASSGTATSSDADDDAPPGDWTLTLSAVIGRDLSQPGMMTFDWEPPPTNPPNNPPNGAGNDDGANGAGNGNQPAGQPGNGGGAGGATPTPTRPPGGPRFGEGPRT